MKQHHNAYRAYIRSLCRLLLGSYDLIGSYQSGIDTTHHTYIEVQSIYSPKEGLAFLGFGPTYIQYNLKLKKKKKKKRQEQSLPALLDGRLLVMSPPLLFVVYPRPRVVFRVVSPCSAQFPASAASSSSSRISASSYRVSASSSSRISSLFPCFSLCVSPSASSVVVWPPSSCSSLRRLSRRCFSLLLASPLLLISSRPPALSCLVSSPPRLCFSL